MKAGLVCYLAVVLAVATASKQKDCDQKRKNCIQVCKGVPYMDFNCDWKQGAVVSSCACAGNRGLGRSSGISMSSSSASASASSIVVVDPKDWCFDDQWALDIFTCAQHKKWGHCDKTWLRRGNYCRKTCFGCDCEDASPNKYGFSCAILANRERCESNTYKDNRYCEKSCGMCGVVYPK